MVLALLTMYWLVVCFCLFGGLIVFFFDLLVIDFRASLLLS